MENNPIHVNLNNTVVVFQTQSTYTLKVIGQDLDGNPKGNVATGTVTIKINDVNDNAPTLEKEQVALFGRRLTKLLHYTLQVN